MPSALEHSGHSLPRLRALPHLPHKARVRIAVGDRSADKNEHPSRLLKDNRGAVPKEGPAKQGPATVGAPADTSRL